ncbi:hypothetical protein P43SY_000346 [Pythium insidiosum]|uniref:Fibronectin type-III domain-containing protein n=1 Tax=Pythium insidiosum TaxID=114742 RepID=A0AAD5M026_PYTIN|nr:hypothetical protein P43SY_000346 [Pythium insidiosum]
MLRLALSLYGLFAALARAQDTEDTDPLPRIPPHPPLLDARNATPPAVESPVLPQLGPPDGEGHVHPAPLEDAADRPHDFRFTTLKSLDSTKVQHAIVFTVNQATQNVTFPPIDAVNPVWTVNRWEDPLAKLGNQFRNDGMNVSDDQPLQLLVQFVDKHYVMGLALEMNVGWKFGMELVLDEQSLSGLDGLGNLMITNFAIKIKSGKWLRQNATINTINFNCKLDIFNFADMPTDHAPADITLGAGDIAYYPPELTVKGIMHAELLNEMGFAIGEIQRYDGALPALSRPPMVLDDRGVRADSVTNQLRLLVKQRQRRRRPAPVLEPLMRADLEVDGSASPRESTSLQGQIQGPLTLQWLVDDFVQAAGQGNVRKVDHYIRGGIPIDMRHSVLQYTALHASSALHDETVTKYLVQAGADVDAVTEHHHESSLHLAARYGSKSVAEEILRNHADMRIINNEHMLAVDVAADVQDHEMARLLEPPPDPPSELRTTVVLASSIAIEWKSNCADGSAYQFRVTWVLDGSSGELSETCAVTSFRIPNLMPASRYQITVQAGNITIGWSAASEPLIVTTDCDVPNAMSAPLVSEVTDHSIKLRIRLPPANGSAIERVSIQMQCAGDVTAVSTRSFRKLLRPADNAQRFPGYKEHSVPGLLPGHVYYFRVKACNSYGWSPDGEVSDGICTNDAPKIVSKSAREMTLVWTKPYSTELIDMYQVQAKPSNRLEWETVMTDIQGQAATVTNLIPATAYSLRVVPHYARSGWEDASKCALTELTTTDATVPEPPLDLHVVDRTAQSVTLAWGIPRFNGHAVVAYELQCRIVEPIEQRDNDWRVIDSEIHVGLKAYTAERLPPGCTFCFRVSARNTLGNSPFAELADPPTPTESSDDEEHASSSAVPPVITYEVEMCQLPSTALQSADLAETIATVGAPWVTVATGLSDRFAQISGLAPLGCYCFRICGYVPRDDATSSERTTVLMAAAMDFIALEGSTGVSVATVLGAVDPTQDAGVQRQVWHLLQRQRARGTLRFFYSESAGLASCKSSPTNGAQHDGASIGKKRKRPVARTLETEAPVDGAVQDMEEERLDSTSVDASTGRARTLMVAACEELRLRALNIPRKAILAEFGEDHLRILEAVGRARAHGITIPSLCAVFGANTSVKKVHNSLDTLLSYKLVVKRMMIVSRPTMRRLNIVHLPRFATDFTPEMYDASAEFESDEHIKKLLASAAEAYLKDLPSQSSVLYDLGRDLGFQKRHLEVLKNHIVQESKRDEGFRLELFQVVLQPSNKASVEPKILNCVRYKPLPLSVDGRQHPDTRGMTLEMGLLHQIYTIIEENGQIGTTIIDLRNRLVLPGNKLPYKLVSILAGTYGLRAEAIILGKNKAFKLTRITRFLFQK